MSINIKREFKINGKTYNSLEEMPADVRAAFTKLTGGKAILGQQLTGHPLQTGITCDRKVYKSIAEVPPEVRQLYESTLKAGATPASLNTINLNFSIGREPENAGAAPPVHLKQPTRFTPSFSIGALIAWVIAGAFLCWLYLLWKNW